MKLRLLAPLLFAAAFARADIIIEQKLESPFMNGNTTIKVKGDNARIDSPTPMGVTAIVLMNFKSGEVTTYTTIEGKKVAMKMNLSDVKKQQEAGQKAVGVDAAKMEKPKATGQKEKVGEYEAEVFEMNQGSVQAKFWVAKDFPNAQSIKDQMMKIYGRMGGGGGVDQSTIDVPGFTVKAEVSTPAGKMITTFVRAKEEPLDDAEFKPLEGYEEIKAPTLPGAGAPK